MCSHCSDDGAAMRLLATIGDWRQPAADPQPGLRSHGWAVPERGVHDGPPSHLGPASAEVGVTESARFGADGTRSVDVAVPADRLVLTAEPPHADGEDPHEVHPKWRSDTTDDTVAGVERTGER
jgi:hypothetical protein